MGKQGPGKGNTNNPAGKPKGIKSKKTKQWEELSEAIITTHADRFNKVLVDLDDDDFAKTYIQVLNYFKPKISHNINEDIKPVEIKGVTFESLPEIDTKDIE